jgi:hypothetical protein
MPADRVDTRLSLLLTLLLTAVAFKTVIGNDLPKISYFTLLDQYVISLFCGLFCLSCEVCIEGVLARLYPDYFTTNENLITLSAFASVFMFWILLHVWFGCAALAAMRHSRARIHGRKTARDDHASKESTRFSRSQSCPSVKAEKKLVL